MHRVLLAVAIVAVIIGGIVAAIVISGEDSEPEARPTPSPEPTEEADPLIAPLTGLDVDDPAVLERSVVALKVDNAPRARPQPGLELADIIFTEIVEGGTTRFIALYHSVLPEEAGPVRSGRDVDAQVLPAFSAVFGISGAAGPTNAVLRDAGLLVYEEGQANAFRRSPGRPAPHNLFASTRALAEASGDLPPAAAPWPFDPAIPEGGEAATSAQLVFSAFYQAAWDWNQERGSWVRSQEGAPHIHAGGEQLGAANVVVARVSAFDGTGIDVGGNPIPEVDAIGEGDAVILRDGHSYPARWRKTDATSQFEWLTPAGEPLPLRPGQTWVELVPLAGSVTVASPPAGG